jgi:hypothetical protein
VTKKLNGDKKRESGGKKQFSPILCRARARLALTDLGLCAAPRSQTIKIEPIDAHSLSQNYANNFTNRTHAFLRPNTLSWDGVFVTRRAKKRNRKK